MKKISVIIPVYNVEAYLDRCIESVINQTYPELEIILVDDGSPDNCPAMCDEWAEKDPRIRVIHQENGGLSAARNAGIKAATGEYIAFVDSDDWIEIDFLKWLYEGIQTTGAEIAACDVRELSVKGEALNITGEPNISAHSPQEAMADLSRGIRFRAVAWNKLYKSEILLNEEFPLNKLHEDEFFTYRIYDKCEILAYVDLPLYAYFQREGSIMADSSLRHLDLLEAYLARQELFKEKHPELYLNDKNMFCATCVNLALCDYEDNKIAMQRIKAYRRQVHFSLKEIKNCSLKQKAYILASQPTFIGASSKLIKRRRNA